MKYYNITQTWEGLIKDTIAKHPNPHEQILSIVNTLLEAKREEFVIQYQEDMQKTKPKFGTKKWFKHGLLNAMGRSLTTVVTKQEIMDFLEPNTIYSRRVFGGILAHVSTVEITNESVTSTICNDLGVDLALPPGKGRQIAYYIPGHKILTFIKGGQPIIK